MSQKKIATDEDLNAEYSRFKMWVSFKDSRNKTFYAKEKNASFRQIVFGKVQSVTFDHEAGFAALIYLAENLYIGKYNTAIIYDRFNPNVEIRKYINGILQQPCIEMEFTTATKCTHYLVKNNMLILAAAGIDFKKEVQQQLSNK